MRAWLGLLAAWVGLGVLLAVLIGLWSLPAVVWLQVFHGSPRDAAYLTMAIIGVLSALIALIGTQYKRLSALARRLRLPRIPSGSGYDRHAPA
jgi:dolichol kinase